MSSFSHLFFIRKEAIIDTNCLLSSIILSFARTAYSQLSYSPFILFGLSAVMVTLFWLPVLGLFYPDWTIRILSLLAWVEMTISYLPTIRYYGLHPAWAMTMPLIGTLYLAMTWSSAFRYWRGERTKWKGRVYS